MKPNADRPGTEPDAKDDLKSLPIPELEKKLGSSPEGLSQAEAQKRLTQYGPNELEEEKTNAFLKFLSYFWGPIPWMIEVAVVLSAVAQHWPDFFIILVLLLANAVVGFWEEHQAGNAIEALKATLAIRARVRPGICLWYWGSPRFWGWQALFRRSGSFVWGYALVWFLVNDRVKLLAYRVFDQMATPLLAGSQLQPENPSS